MARAIPTPLTLTGAARPGAVLHGARGRGAGSNDSGRFEPVQRVPLPDWTGEAPPPLRTTVTPERARRILTTNASPDIAFDQSINPYRGCEHGCIYCYARPTHAYMGLSPGLDFESRLFAKTNAAEALEAEVSQRRYRVKVIALGANTDPYQPIERRFEITRAVLQVLARHRHPAVIVTKSHLVTRDIDILAPMARQNLVKVCLSVTTLDPRLARAMEPRASTPTKRLAALRALARAGIPAGVMVAPIIPALNDSEIETVLAAAHEAGAAQAAYVLLRLPLEVKGLFEEWLDEVVPNRAAHIMRVLKEMRGGKAYESEWGVRMRGRGPYADMIAHRFRAAVKRLGLNGPSKPLNTTLFRHASDGPAPPEQLALL